MRVICFQAKVSRSILAANHFSQRTNGDKDFSAHIHRALTRLKAVYITLFNNWSGQGTGPAEVMLPGMRKACNDFDHPTSMKAAEDLINVGCK